MGGGGGRPSAQFDEFYAKDYAKVVVVVALVTGDREAAREAVNEAVARAWEQMRKGVEIESLAAWTRTVALNFARGRFRRASIERRAREDLERLIPSSYASDDASCLAIDARRGLAMLSRRQREVTVLHYFAGLTVEQVAAELCIRPGTVKVCLHRARAALATQLETKDVEVTS